MYLKLYGRTLNKKTQKTICLNKEFFKTKPGEPSPEEKANQIGLDTYGSSFEGFSLETPQRVINHFNNKLIEQRRSYTSNIKGSKRHSKSVKLGLNISKTLHKGLFI